MTEKEKLLEVDAETIEVFKAVVKDPVKKAVVAAFVQGLEMRASLNAEEKTA